MNTAPFELRSQWDDGWRLLAGGLDSAVPHFAAAADRLGLSVQPDNAFARAYRSEIDTALAFDGSTFVVTVRDARAVSPALGTLEEADAWLDAEIRRELPDSAYAQEATR